MNAMHLQDAIGGIDDAFIDEASQGTILRSKAWMPAAALAACILLTVALVPWKALLSGSEPQGTDPILTDTAIGVLDNNTTGFDTTKKPDSTPVIIPNESTVPATDDTSNQISILPPDSTNKAPETVPDTKKPLTDESSDARNEETTSPLASDKPAAPDHGITVPTRPSVLSRPVYPQQTKYSLTNLLQWRNEKTERINYYSSRVGNIDSFISLTVSEFFADSENENLIYSPLNAYMSLGMLAEASGGNSRVQLLDFLGSEGISTVRANSENLWNSTYRDDGIVTAILANSVWLDGSVTPRSAVTDILSDSYYASSFRGDMGDGEYNELMRSWINEQTKGALSDSVSQSAFDADSVMSLMSTVYYKAEWDVAFDSETTRSRVFHSSEGDVTAQFMYRDFVGIRYVGKNFETTCLDLKEGGKMWLILPDEDVSLQSLFTDAEALGFITGKTQKTLPEKGNTAYMWLFLPKFDISSSADLEDRLSSLGRLDAFNSKKADFSTLTASKAFVNNVTQSTRVSIDEDGCEGASVTGQLPGISDSETYGFTLDRPFIFVVTSDTGLPLFVGTVNRPN